jgi:hypothetical protein
MGKCARHPEKETRFQCLKHNVWLCDECLRCRDPELYCKNRSACPIWFIEKRRKRLQKKEQAAAALRVPVEPDAEAVDVPAGSGRQQNG